MPPAAIVLAAALAAPLVLAATPAAAVKPDEVLADPALEERARALSARLRCMVCQNQSIDDSDAELARDLRLLVRERLKSGDSDREVVDFLVARYGEFVLLQPVWSLRNTLLWTTPLLALAGGIAAIWAAFRRRPAVGEGAALSAEESRKLRELLSRGD
jgi:cytochrome c-type biogenesis protein CcmH